MYWNDYQQHKQAHIHANYAEFEAVIDFNAQLLAGDLPKTAKKLVKKWILENQEMLNYAWTNATSNRPLPKIQSLK